MARPTTIPSWATAITPATPSAGTLQVGAVAGQAASPDDSNWIWKYLAEWSTYTSEISPSDRLLDVDAIRSTSSGAGVTPTALTLTGLSLSLQGSDGTTATQWTMAAGSAIFTYDDGATTTTYGAFVPAYGWAYTIGQIVTTGTADDGFRYGYASSVAGGATGLALVRNLSQSPGLWGFVDTAYASPVIDHEVRKDKSTGALFVINGSASSQTIEVERDLLPEAADNAAARTAGGTVYTVTALEGEIGSGLATDILVQVVRRTLGSGTESVLATLPSSGTPLTTAALTSQTNTGLSLALDFNQYAYTLRVVTTGVVGNSTGGLWRDVKVTIRKDAVE
jgi:hypothetical protein